MATICRACGTQNPDQAKFCLNCASPLEAPSERGERKLATVLFADLVGSTAMASDQDPERTRQILTRFYDAMQAEVERYGGTLEKFAGDAVMAAFGAPAALEDHAERALHAAMAMHRRMRELFGEQLALRIGINTGDVLVGRPREGSSFVTGDPVNVAARLEQAASAGETLAGERTFAAALGAFEFDEPTTVEAKGKVGGVVARRVLRAVSLMRPRGLRDMPSVFVGRENELDDLQARYRQVIESGRPHHVTILGDAGVGKSRLTRELWDWLAHQSPEPTRRIGRTLSYGQGTTYWPVGEVLKEQFGIAEDEPPESIGSKLAERPYLALTLGLPLAEDLHPLVARERLHDAWVALLADLAAERPVVLLIEDAHWAADDLCDLIDTLVDQVPGPLLMVVTARPEMLDRRPAWGGALTDASVIRLEALPQADTTHLLDGLLGEEVPGPIREMVVERAEGNPFFVEELVATLVDRGVLHRDDHAWSFGPLPEGFTVPDSVQAVLAARIDLLAGPEKGGLQAASVIGRTFWTGPVYELVAGAPPDFGVLEEREFVRRQPTSSLPGEREYTIKHALTREVAYGTLPKAERARLHAAFAAWLEGRAEARPELAPIVAHHYAQAVRPEDRDLAWVGQEDEARRLRASAVAWSRRAADLAIARYEIDNALGLLRKAVELEEDAAGQAQLWYEIGHASALKYDGEGFVAALETALELGAAPGVIYPELAFQTSLRQGMWRRQLDPVMVEGWIADALATAPEGSRDRLRALVARAYWHGDMAAAQSASQLAERLGDPVLRSDAIGANQVALNDAGRFSEAGALIEARTALLPMIGDPDHVADALFTHADLLVILGRLGDARTVVDRLGEMAANLTPHHRVHWLAMRQRLQHALGAWDEIAGTTAVIEDAVEANLATPCPFNVGLLLRLAVAKTYRGDADAAGSHLGKAESIGMVGYGRLHADEWLSLAIARHDRDETQRMVAAVEPEWLLPSWWQLWSALFDGLALLGDRERIEAEAPAWLDRGTYVDAFARRALGLIRTDEGLLTDAAARFEAMGMGWHAAETRAALERIRR